MWSGIASEGTVWTLSAFHFTLRPGLCALYCAVQSKRQPDGFLMKPRTVNNASFTVLKINKTDIEYFACHVVPLPKTKKRQERRRKAKIDDEIFT